MSHPNENDLVQQTLTPRSRRTSAAGFVSRIFPSRSSKNAAERADNGPASGPSQRGNAAALLSNSDAINKKHLLSFTDPDEVAYDAEPHFMPLMIFSRRLGAGRCLERAELGLECHAYLEGTRLRRVTLRVSAARPTPCIVLLTKGVFQPKLLEIDTKRNVGASKEQLKFLESYDPPVMPDGTAPPNLTNFVVVPVSSKSQPCDPVLVFNNSEDKHVCIKSIALIQTFIEETTSRCCMNFS